MFGYNDKLNVSLINFQDVEGNILPLNYNLPLKEDIALDEIKNVVMVQVAECEENNTIGIQKAFKICVGSASTIRNILQLEKK